MPIFKHDCDLDGCCMFIGNRKGKDIYTAEFGKIVLIRYGNSPEENLTYSLDMLTKIGLFDDWL